MPIIVDELVTVFSAKDQLSQAAKSMKSSLTGLESSLVPLVGTGAVAGGLVGGLAAALGAIVVAVGSFTAASVKAAIPLDTLERGLAAVTGEGKAMEDQMKRLEKIAELPGLKLNDAVMAFTDLVSGGVDAKLAERSLAAFGNALASVGRGAADLGGAMYGLRQLATSDILKAEDLNIIVERVPQAAKILKEFYGTARGEELTKMGVTPVDAINSLIAGLEALPSAAGGAQNTLDNLDDKWTQVLATVGKPILKDVVMPFLDSISKFLSTLKSNGVLDEIGRGFADLFNVQQNSEFIKFLSLVTRWLRGVPPTLKLIANYLGNLFQFWAGRLDAMLAGIEKASFGFLKLPRIGELVGADALMKQFDQQHETGIEGVLDKAIGTLSGKSRRDTTLEKIEKNTRPLLDFQQFVLGGGNLAQMGVTPSEIAGMKSGRMRRSNDRVEEKVWDLVDAIEERAKAAAHQAIGNQRRMGYA